ncbi:MAG: helix-turn-helix transcriptional regulator [Prevotella sp.]|nr:helix-turn-helix transcriptional regulator [Prevotella sp.]
MKRFPNFVTILLFAVLAFAGCTKPNRSEEVKKLKTELQEMLFRAPEQALARVDSAEQAGVFSTATANLIRTNIYGNMGQTRLAVFYGEQILNVPELKKEGDTYYSAILMLIGLLERNGEYGKAIRLSDEMIADVENERKQGGGLSGISEQVALRVKSRALTFKGDCEYHLEHPDEAERYYLEGIDLMMDGVKHPDDYWVIDPLIISIIETTEFYLEQGKAEKALALVAKGDTALARLDRCPNVPDRVYHLRHNNITIGQAMVYAANGQRDKAEALYLKHRQAENPSVYDIGADARYLAMTDRYDEAIRLFRQADSLHLAKGGAINTVYIKNYLMNQYETLQKAGRKDEVLAMADRMRQLTDSIHLQERKIDVEQQQEIRQKEAEIANRRQSLLVYRILAVAAFIVCGFIVYLFWRATQYNKVITEKNRRLVAEIEQREREEQQAIEQLKAEPEERLTAEQQLFRSICNLMDSPDHIYTEADLDRYRLAQLLGTNEHYVTDAISACANGKSVNGFLNDYRLRYAAHLLATTNDSVALIAELSGFSRSSFFRIFSDSYGMSPADYRRIVGK